MQNGNCEAFNGRMRGALLNETLFLGIDHAREAVTRWTRTYNTERPHSALSWLATAAFPHEARKWAISFAQPKRCADRPLLRRRSRAKLNKGAWSRSEQHPGLQRFPPAGSLFPLRSETSGARA